MFLKLKIRRAAGRRPIAWPEWLMSRWVARPPRHRPARLLVLGDWARFHKSVLGNAARAGLIAAVSEEYFLRFPRAGRMAVINFGSQPQIQPAIRLAFGARILNARPVDDTKSSVASHMQRVFGYSAAVDPTSWHGSGVVKSEWNAMHDGRTIDLPIALREPDRAYERLIDNGVGGGLVLDYRVCIVAGRISHVYLKYRRPDIRFLNFNQVSRLVSPGAVLSTAERRNCLSFATSIGLDFCELDVLRDRKTGLIYIVDATGTPYGPPKASRASEYQMALRIYADHIRAAAFDFQPASGFLAQLSEIRRTPALISA